MKQSLSKTVTQETKKLELKKVAVCIAVCLYSSASFAFDLLNKPKAPHGWTQVDRSAYTGGGHYRNVHTYQNTEGDFVALVDLAGGARVRMLQIQAGKDPNGHNTFWRKSLDDWWKQMPERSSRVLVVNGQYFNPKVKNSQTTLSYAVRDRTWASFSGNPNDHKLPLRQIEFFQDGVVVQNAKDDWWVQTSAPDGLLGRHPNDVVNANGSVGRTVLCSLQYSSKFYARSPVLLIAVARAKKQRQVNDMLSSEWKCDLNHTIVMDGSASSQMKTYSGNDVSGVDNSGSSGRSIPQAIGVFDH